MKPPWKSLDSYCPDICPRAQEARRRLDGGVLMQVRPRPGFPSKLTDRDRDRAVQALRAPVEANRAAELIVDRTLDHAGAKAVPRGRGYGRATPLRPDHREV